MEKLQRQIHELQVKDCFGISLRKGTLIIGYLNAVLSAIAILIILGLGIMVGVFAAGSSKEKTREVVLIASIGLAVGIILLLVCFVLFVFSVMLLIGVYKKRTKLIKYYLRFILVLTVLATLGLPFGIISEFAFGTSMAGQSILVCIATFGGGVYTWIVIRSYYRQLKEELSGHVPAAVAYGNVTSVNHGPYQSNPIPRAATSSSPQ